MARNTDRYVRYYTFGSTAAKLDRQESRPGLPKMKPQPKRKPIPVDPVAFVGSAVALVLAVLMVVGLVQVTGTVAQVRQEEERIMVLELEQQKLLEVYEEGYDLEQIRAEAESMGMIPAADAFHVRVQVPTQITVEPRLSWWDSLLVSLRQFFA